MSKQVQVRIELSIRDLHAVVRIAEELGKAKDKFMDEEVVSFLEKVADAFTKAADKLKEN
jgi:hypothetical protein